MNDKIAAAAALLRDAELAIASTGAGISVESGIPDFRSPGGLWEKYPPDQFATIDAYLANPDRVWALWHELGQMLSDRKPNAAHTGLAKLEAHQKLHAVITQNIDNLHQDAGSVKVIEYHGNAKRITCLKCGLVKPLTSELKKETAPRCTCGGLMKPDVVLFGEMIPQEAMMEAEMLAQSCDVMLIIGTSAQVYPAAGLPYTAKENGARIIECNLERTGFTREITDVFLQGKAGVILPLLTQAVAIII